MKNLSIKRADSKSAKLIVDIHYDAVHGGKAKNFYKQEILNDWAPPVSQERIKSFREKIIETQPVILLAYIDNQPVGFGVLDIEQDRIGAIYVKASFAGLHVGRSLLQELERIASLDGCRKLDLESSLNAETFYAKHDYLTISESLFTLPSGKQMKSVIMSKMLRSALS